MSKLHHEALFAHSPEQTYLNERLQSARWLGWTLPVVAPQTQSTPNARSATAMFAEAVGLATDPASGEPI
nr:hypothetical protein [Rhodoferax sp.]